MDNNTQQITAAVSKLRKGIAAATSKEPTANHDANKATLMLLVAEKSKEFGYVGEEVIKRCLLAFETACEDQHFVAACAAYSKTGAFSAGSVLNTLLDILDY